MAWTLCTSSSAIVKAGANANSTIVDYSTSQTELDSFSTEAEGSIETATGKSYIADFASTPAGVQGALNDVCSSMVAMKIIAYDTRGYFSREADTLLNVNARIVDRGLKDLQDSKKYKLVSPV